MLKLICVSEWGPMSPMWIIIPEREAHTWSSFSQQWYQRRPCCTQYRSLNCCFPLQPYWSTHTKQKRASVRMGYNSWGTHETKRKSSAKILILKIFSKIPLCLDLHDTFIYLFFYIISEIYFVFRYFLTSITPTCILAPWNDEKEFGRVMSLVCKDSV